MLARLGLRTRVFLLFAGLAAGICISICLGLWLAYSRLGDRALSNAFVQAGSVAGFLGLGLVAWLWYLFDTNVARPIDILAGTLRARAHAQVDGELDGVMARYLGDLAPAAQAAAASLSETRSALAEAVARETSRLSAEKERLETLLADVPVGVLLCSGAHQLVFYNGQASDLIGSDADGPRLDRPLFDYLREGPIRMAHVRLIGTKDREAASDILCATVSGARILAGRMRLIEPQGGEGLLPGYVLTLHDVTADMVAKSARDLFLQDLFERINRSTANLSALVSALPEDEVIPGRIHHALLQANEALVTTVTDLSRKGETLRADGPQMSPIRTAELIDGVSARLEASGMEVTLAHAAPVQIQCDAFGIVSLLAGLAIRMRDHGLAASFGITAEEESSYTCLRLLWQGPPLSVAKLEDWLNEPFDPALPEVTGRDILRDNSTELWPERREDGHALCMPVPQVRREVRRPAPISRTVVYDFDLLDREKTGQIAEARLDKLNCVVFDTETTGLLPQQGDEIVQLAAVRIVNGRIVDSEVFDTLVNPGRPIPAGSTEVHGITDVMVADAPSVAEALRRFHRFAAGAVLVAHNAPFDMQFLRRREEELGLRFDHPVLDTVLLSAVVFGQHEVHSLDALTHRLAVTIPEEARHTAIGDARATAEAFLRLVRILNGRKLSTFGTVVGELRRHARLLKDLNA